MIISNDFKKHLINICFIALLFSCVCLLVVYNFLPEYILQIYPFVVVYFVGFSAIHHFCLHRAMRLNPNKFYTEYMKWFGIKMLSHLVFILVYVLNNRESALPFVLYFGLCYLVFTSYDVYSLSKKTN